MTPRELLEKLQALDVEIIADGDRIRCNAPAGVLTPELKEEMSRRKPEILAYLRAVSITRSSLVPIQPKGSRPPFVGIGGHNGDVFCYVRIAHSMGEEQPFYALQPPGLEGECEPLTRTTDLAAHYAGKLREALPEGPYYLGGYCAGGVVAFDVASQLRASGADVRLLALFGSPCPTGYALHKQIRGLFRYLRHRIPFHVRTLMRSGEKKPLRYLLDRLNGFTREVLARRKATQLPSREVDFKENVSRATIRGIRSYRPAVYEGDIHLFLASELSMKQNFGFELDWRNFGGGRFQVHTGPPGCTSDTMLQDPYAEAFGNQLRECLEKDFAADHRSARVSGVGSGPA